MAFNLTNDEARAMRDRFHSAPAVRRAHLIDIAASLYADADGDHDEAEEKLREWWPTQADVVRWIDGDPCGALYVIKHAIDGVDPGRWILSVEAAATALICDLTATADLPRAFVQLVAEYIKQQVVYELTDGEDASLLWETAMDAHAALANTEAA